MSPTDSYALHRRVLEQMKQTPYLDYPHLVQLETLALCPAACSFCPYPSLTRQGERMDDALIEKVLKDLEDIPPQLPFHFLPYKVNEPFLDKRLIPLLQSVNQRLPNAFISLTSSGAPITEARLIELSSIRNMNYLSISLNEHRPEAYTRLMQLPWERTRERLDLLHRFKAEGRLNFKIILWRVGDGSPDDQDFKTWAQAHYPRFEASVNPRGEWLGQVEGLQPSAPEVPDIGCLRWFELSITSSGTVAFCCMDGQAEWPLGDVRSQHLLDVYNAPAYRRLREQLPSRRAASPCSACSLM